MSDTNLILGIEGFPPECACNCVQELTPIANGEFRKSINNQLAFLKVSEFQKYKSVIMCSDSGAPLIDKLQIGKKIEIGCIQPMWQTIPAGETKVKLHRPAVENSICVINENDECVMFTYEDNTVEVQRPYAAPLYVRFRPWLIMMVTNFQISANEWTLKGGWRLESEEI